MVGKTTRNTKVGDRKIYYGEVWLFKQKKSFSGGMEVATKGEARKALRQTVLKRFGNVKYKVTQLFDLPPEMDVEEVD